MNLIPGNYRVEAEKPGFKRVTQEPVVVQVQQNSKIDLALPIGQATETVEVTSETPLLQSETSSLGQVVDARKATELPLNGRNIYNLAAVAPSVVPQGNTTGFAGRQEPIRLRQLSDRRILRQRKRGVPGWPAAEHRLHQPAGCWFRPQTQSANSKCNTTTWARSGASSPVASST